MEIDDPALPAAQHLVGDAATPALAAAVEAFGGRLEHARVRELQYRPGRDLVARYDAAVSWAGSDPRRETLVASTTHRGVPAGTVPMEAADESGNTVSVGVWRWPFDPVLTGLATAVTRHRIAPFVHGLVGTPTAVTVRAYRPTERAVVQISGGWGLDVFVKVVAPASLQSLVERHRQLHAAGVPVPAVLATDDELGLVVLEELPGRTMRSQLNAQAGPWPTTTAFREVFNGFARAELADAVPVRSRASMALGHARMLRTVAPRLSGDLAEFDGFFRRLAERSAARTGAVIHGDLYDAQLLSHGSRITGVLDVDDAGPGDPVDDRATVLAFLLVKAMHSATGRIPIARYAHALRSGFGRDVDHDDLDTATAAVLVGLATGPFRNQVGGWRADVKRHLDLARHVLESPDVPAFN